ncbi:MAG: 30S ribosomal protein S3 [Candidatus Buchananbacteria bacterium CG10_big_fil_rev_8_21_14_0_10_42_9]|uniref:Small ribosomal subunit protein uS3 n=1 Tax=Candidatus Buchananbacteria bacterium CG10_big_fil_rev_8_21_14_0_10_42_9 TaxID=1974526 RepID=A0A2H0W228_9BACT|nr:MAG: 30S ribosomal protein S3 [Candidatus Buchananbacteria bacterium CG10_big_fil_rev_8_21_14_0_10_42_9]
MGQKVHPRSYRLSTIYHWSSKWFSRDQYANFLQQDLKIKKFLRNELKAAAIANIEIDRSGNDITVIIHSAKPGVIIGRGGKGVDEVKTKLQKFLPPKTSLNLSIKEVNNPNLNAELVCQAMIADLEKRVPFRRVLKQTIARVEKAGAKGVKVMAAGRLNGVEIARTEKLVSGNLPLSTLRADIDFARGAAKTTYGAIGVKVWIYKGEVFGDQKVETDSKSDTKGGKRKPFKAK